MTSEFLDYRIEARGNRDWIVSDLTGRYVGAITRFIGERFEYRTSQSTGRNYWRTLIEAERALIAFDNYQAA